MLVRWIFGDSEAEFLGWLQVIPDVIFRTDGMFSVESPRLILFDSALAGRNVKKRPQEYLALELGLGVYAVRTAIYQPDARTSMVVHRFEPFS